MALLAAACTSTNGGTGAATTSNSDDPNLLMVQGAGSAQFETDADGMVELVLTDVDDDTIYFSDRPNHIAGSYDTTEFVDKILPVAYSDAGGPPNAALVWMQDELDRTVIVELTGATYDADASVVRYQVTVVEDEPDLLVPCQATFARFTSSRSAVLWALRFRQAM